MEHILDEKNRIMGVTLDDLMHPYLDEPIRVGIVARKTSGINGSDMDAIRNSILYAANSDDYHVIVAPEYSFISKNGPITKDEKEHYVNVFKNASSNNKLIIPGTFVWQENGTMYNRAYVFDKGSVKTEYDKNRDGGESIIAKRVNLVPHFGKVHCAFGWGKLKLGVEICADAGLLYQREIFDRDLTIQISAGCGLGARAGKQSLREGGYCVVAEGAYGDYFAEQKSDNSILDSSEIIDLPRRGPVKKIIDIIVGN